LIFISEAPIDEGSVNQEFYFNNEIKTHTYEIFLTSLSIFSKDYRSFSTFFLFGFVLNLANLNRSKEEEAELFFHGISDL
jgi:hypothetical protein